MSPASAGRSRRGAAERARDEKMMKAALSAARKGDGRTHPNPSVGAVVFRGDEILGRGTTKPPGGPHAEIVAMENSRKRHGDRSLQGASIAATLEPCSFSGRTGPCADALVEAGITSVAVGCLDPHPRVAGRGIKRLRAAGIQVETGVREEECRYTHRGFLSVIERGRPWITLKLATTLDGRIATAAGESRWITGSESRAKVHRLRNAYDAVMVGSGTALADDPSLTVRSGENVLRTPTRILVDSRLRVPATHQLFSDPASAKTWVVCGTGARGIAKMRETAGSVIEIEKGRDRKLDLPAMAAALADSGLTTLLVEGGGGLAAALIRADLVDEVHWMLAPKLIGSEGFSGLGPLAVDALGEAVVIEPLEFAVPGIGKNGFTQAGPDIHVHGLIRRNAKTEGSGRRKISRPAGRKGTKA